MRFISIIISALIVSVISLLPPISGSVAPTDFEITFDTTNLSRDGESHDAKIAVNGNNLYVVWVGDDSKNGEIYFTRSIDGGLTFSDPINISNANGLSTGPELAVSGNNVYVAWRDQALGRDNILLARGTSAGTAFTEPVNLSKEIVTSGVAYMSNYQIAVLENNVYVVWSVQVGELGQIFFTKSNDAGASFSTPMSVSKNREGYAAAPQMTVSGDNVYIAWNKGNVVPGERIYPDVYFTISRNGGLTFSEPIIMTGHDAINTIPQVASSNGNIYLAWYHSAYSNSGTTNSSIFFTRSTDQGSSFGNITKIAEHQRLELGIPRMVASGDNVYIVWRLLDERKNLYEVFFTTSSDGGVTFSKAINLNNIPRGLPPFEIGTSPAIAVSGNNVYVAWSDITSEGNYETFLVASSDQGVSFTDPTNLSNSKTSMTQPEIVASGNASYVMWTEYVAKGLDVFFSKVSIQSDSASPPPSMEEDIPIKITKVELWGPSYFVEGINICGWGKTSISDAFQWVEIRNTTNEEVTTLPNWSITFTNGTEFSFAPGLRLGPKESCLIQTADGISTGIGPGGSGGIGPPSGHSGSAVILKYRVDMGIVSTIHKDSAPVLSDTYGDTRNWQLIDGEWVFKNGKLPDTDRTTLTETTEDGSVIVNLILAEEITAPTDSKFRVSFIDADTQQLMHNVIYQIIFEGTSIPVNTSSVPLGLVSKDNPFKLEWSIDGIAKNGTDTQIYSISSPGSLNITIRILSINNMPLAEPLNVKFSTLATSGVPDPLQITEVELNAADGGQWFELHNPTDRPINASKLVLKQLAGEWATARSETPLAIGFGKQNFTLNSVMLLPDEYRVFEISSEDDSPEERFLTSSSVLSLLINEREVSRTPELSDEDGDSRTWQLEEKQWVFAEATPSKAIPEFPVSMMMMMAIGVSVMLMSLKYRR